MPPDDLTPSMKLGDLLCARSIHGFALGSAVGRRKSVVGNLEPYLPDALEIHNASDLMEEMRHILERRPLGRVSCVNLLPR